MLIINLCINNIIYIDKKCKYKMSNQQKIFKEKIFDLPGMVLIAHFLLPEIKALLKAFSTLGLFFSYISFSVCGSASLRAIKSCIYSI